MAMPLYSAVHLLLCLVPSLASLKLADLVQDRSRSLFDFCDLSQYTPDGIRPLLEASHVGENRWAALLMFNDGSMSIPQLCPDVTWHDSYVLYSTQLLAVYIQDAGGIGILQNVQNSIPRKYWTYESMDKSSRTVFGKKLGIFVMVTDNQGSIERIVNLAGEAQSKKVPLVANSLTADSSGMDEAITNPASLFRLGQYLLITISTLGLLHSLRVTLKYFHIKGKSLPLNYCTYSLVVTVIANVFRIARSSDILGFQGIVPFWVARPLYSAPAFLYVASALSTFFFWLQAAIQIDHSLDLRMVSPPRRFKVATVGLSTAAVAVDVWISSATVTGKLYGNVTLVPVVALLIINTSTAISILLATRKMNKVVNRISTIVKSEDGGVSSPPLRSNKEGGATKGTAVTAPLEAPSLSRPLAVKLSRDANNSGNKTAHAPDAIPVYAPAPALAHAKVGVSKDMSQLDSLKIKLSNKVKAAEMWMTRTGVSMLVYTILLAVLGSNIQYRGPNQLVLFVVAPIVEQTVSYFEMRVLDVSVEKM